MSGPIFAAESAAGPFEPAPWASCRHCGCRQASPCVGPVGPGFYSAYEDGQLGTCSWAAEGVCTNPACVEAEYLNLTKETS